MTDTLLDYDPNDTGDIPRPIGETARIITADDRERLIGENTENLGQYLRPDAPFMTTVRFAAGDRIGRETTDYPTIGILPDPGSGQPTLVYGMGRTIDMEETVVHGIRYSLAGPQSPPPPLPRPSVPPKYDLAAAPTEVVTILGTLAGLDGELRPDAYVGRHRDPLGRTAEVQWGRMVEAAKPAGEPRRLRVLVGVGAFIVLLAVVSAVVLRVFS
jgi:hypothetical protein